MDPRQREKLLAQIPTPDLRVEAFEKLGDDRSIELMLGYQGQLEQILAEAEAETKVPARRINSRATLIGALVGTGLGAAEAFLAKGLFTSLPSSSSEEVVKGVTEIAAVAIVAVGTLFGGGIGFSVGNILGGGTKSRFIYDREEQVQQRHRELLEAQLTDDQVAALFLKIAAEE